MSKWDARIFGAIAAVVATNLVWEFYLPWMAEFLGLDFLRFRIQFEAFAGLAALLAGGLVFSAARRDQQRDKELGWGGKQKRLRPWMTEYGIASGIATLTLGTIHVFPSLLEAFLNLGHVAFTICWSGIMIGVGWGAYKFKRWDLYAYGGTEAIIASVLIIYQSAKLGNAAKVPENWTVMIGAVYFLARGLGNWHDGDEKRKKAQKWNDGVDWTDHAI